MFALIVPDGDFDLPKHLLITFADRRAEGRDSGRRIEIKDAQEVFVFKPFVGLHITPAHQRIGDADRRGVPELYSDIVYIVLFQIRIRNVVENRGMQQAGSSGSDMCGQFSERKGDRL